MAIYRLLQNSAFEPEQVQEMTRAYESVCAALGLTERRTDPFTEIVARAIIEIAQTGVRSGEELHALALSRLAPHKD